MDSRVVTGGAFPTPGATQALQRTELVPVLHNDRRATVPRPSLLGAIVGKAVATGFDTKEVDRHLRDLAFPCSLVEDPFVLWDQLTRKDRQRLRVAVHVLVSDHSAWRCLAEGTHDAQAAWAVLSQP